MTTVYKLLTHIDGKYYSYLKSKNGNFDKISTQYEIGKVTLPKVGTVLCNEIIVKRIIPIEECHALLYFCF